MCVRCAHDVYRNCAPRACSDFVEAAAKVRGRAANPLSSLSHMDRLLHPPHVCGHVMRACAVQESGRREARVAPSRGAAWGLSRGPSLTEHVCTDCAQRHPSWGLRRVHLVACLGSVCGSVGVDFVSICACDCACACVRVCVFWWRACCISWGKYTNVWAEHDTELVPRRVEEYPMWIRYPIRAGAT